MRNKARACYGVKEAKSREADNDYDEKSYGFYWVELYLIIKVPFFRKGCEFAQALAGSGSRCLSITSIARCLG
jgi:hypothetical protein